jgi:endonuclease YncB( thermonuclease family)
MAGRALVVIIAVVLAAPAAAYAGKGPCTPGASQPRCNFTNARVTFIADGDTIRVKTPGSRRVKTIRFTGINAMELHRYSKYRARRRGECHGVQATNLIERYIKRAHGKVRLGDQRDDSRSGERLRRSVWVRSGGRWVDLAKVELQRGLVLWLPNGVEWAHNAEYHQLAAQAAAAQRGLYDPKSCGAGPDDDIPLRMWVNWDADSDDEQNLNGEWVEIVNDGSRALSLKGWWLRDSWLNYGRRPGGRRVPGYPFPPSAQVPAGGAIRVHVGCGSDTAADLYWCQKTSAFENVTHDERHLGDGAYLFDPQGDLRKSFLYACVLACSDPAQGRVAVDVHPNGEESVSVTNTGGDPLSLFGYVLKIHNPNVADSFIASYAFGQNDVLAPGATRRIGLEDDWGLGSNVLRDREGTVSLRTFSDIVVGCHAWGSAGGC